MRNRACLKRAEVAELFCNCDDRQMAQFFNETELFHKSEI